MRSDFWYLFSKRGTLVSGCKLSLFSSLSTCSRYSLGK